MEVVHTKSQNVTVTKIRGDGNCLFAAMAHQIWGDDNNSPQLWDKTTKLRKQVTRILRELKEEYHNQLLEGVRERAPKYDNIEGISKSNKEELQIEALITDLENEGFWGGGESIAVVSNWYKLNISIHMENGETIVIKPKTETDNINIVYRKNIKGVWNHYDSVVSTKLLHTNPSPALSLDKEGIMAKYNVNLEHNSNTNNQTITTSNYSQLASQHQISNKTKLATWNVRGCSTWEKREKVDQALKDMGIDLACLQELHMSSGSVTTDNYCWHQGGNCEGKTYGGVGIVVRNSSRINIAKFIPISDRLGLAHTTIDNKNCIFINVHIPCQGDKRMRPAFKQLNDVIRDLKRGYPNSPIIIMGDWNAHIGKDDINKEDKQLIGMMLKHIKDNENGTQMKILTHLNNLRIENTWSNSKTILTTWSNGKAESQLDHIASFNPNKNHIISHIKACWITEVNTDHKMIKADFKWKERIEIKSKTNYPQRYNWNIDRLKDPNDKLNYQLCALAKRNQDGTKEKQNKNWEDLIQYTLSSASETLRRPNSPNTPKRRKATAEVMKAQFQYFRNPNQEKKERLKMARIRKMESIEEHRETKFRKLLERASKIHPNQRLHLTYKYLKKKKKNNFKYISMEKWEEVMNNQPEIENINMLEETDHWPLTRPALKDETIRRLEEWKANSAPGIDRISAEMLKAAPTEVLDDLQQILNRAWITNDIPHLWTTSIQIPIPKIQYPKETNDYRRITLCSVAYKLHAKHILFTLDNIIERLPDYQAAYLPNRSTDDHTFTVRRILEEGWKEGKRKYVLALDLAKAFDTVKHSAIITILQHQNVPKFLINRIIKSCLKEESSIMWFGQKTRTKVKTIGVKQGCPLSPRIFNMVIHEVVQSTYEGLNTVDWSDNPRVDPILLAFADDLILISEETEKLGSFMHELIPNLNSVGLKLNMDKCQILIRDPKLHKEDGGNLINIKIGDYSFPVVNSVKYLGITLSNGLHRPDTTKLRIVRATKSMHAITNTLKNHKLSWNLIRAIYNSIIAPAAIYGIKTSAMTKENRKALRNMERMALQLLSGLSRNKMVNKVFKNLKGKTINQKIRAQRIRYWGHIMRRENKSTIQKALKLRAKHLKVGRPCFTWNDTLEDDLKRIEEPDIGWENLIKDKATLKKFTEKLYENQEPSDSEEEEASGQSDIDQDRNKEITDK